MEIPRLYVPSSKERFYLPIHLLAVDVWSVGSTISYMGQQVSDDDGDVCDA